MSNFKRSVSDLFFFFVGAFLYSVSVVSFTSQNDMVPGGVTGISVMINRIFSFPTGLSVLILNIPLFVAGFLKKGKGFILRSFAATIIFSFFLDFSAPYLPVFSKDRLLCAIFGGVFSGLGLGLVFSRGATTGGSDLAGSLIAEKLKRISVGRLIFVLDLAVAISSAFVYKSPESALYSCVVFYISGHIIDKALYTLDSGKTVFIVSEKGSEIAENIIKKLGRGATLIPSRGAYTGDMLDTVFCVVRPNQLYMLISISRSIDKDCFIAASDAGNIEGKGFERVI